MPIDEELTPFQKGAIDIIDRYFNACEKANHTILSRLDRPETVEAVGEAIWDKHRADAEWEYQLPLWDKLPDSQLKDEWRDKARAAITAIKKVMGV